MEVFVTVMPESYHEGYATAAFGSAAAHLFKECGANELRADVVEENTASVRLFTKLGFRKKGPVQREAEHGVFAHREMRGFRYVMTSRDFDKLEAA